MDDYHSLYNGPVCQPHKVHLYVGHGSVILPCILKVSSADLNCLEILCDVSGRGSLCLSEHLLYVFYCILSLAGNKDRHNISDKFDFQPD